MSSRPPIFLPRPVSQPGTTMGESGVAAMHRYVALLRAVNVGGTGKLPMCELRAMCEELGFEGVRTYIASGNVVFASALDETGVKRRLAPCLEIHAGKPVGVMVRTAAELAAVLARNPFPQAAANRVAVVFLDEAPPPDAVEHASGVASEELVVGRREIYVHYGEGIAQSRLELPAARAGTMRNMNTVAKLVGMAIS